MVAKHLEKARKDGVTLDEIPFATDDPAPVLRELPGPGKFSLTRTATSGARRPAISLDLDAGRLALPAKRSPDTQQKLPARRRGIHVSARVALRAPRERRARSIAGCSPRAAG